MARRRRRSTPSATPPFSRRRLTETKITLIFHIVAHTSPSAAPMHCIYASASYTISPIFVDQAWELTHCLLYTSLVNYDAMCARLLARERRSIKAFENSFFLLLVTFFFVIKLGEYLSFWCWNTVRFKGLRVGTPTCQTQPARCSLCILWEVAQHQLIIHASWWMTLWLQNGRVVGQHWNVVYGHDIPTWCYNMAVGLSWRD